MIRKEITKEINTLIAEKMEDLNLMKATVWKAINRELAISKEVEQYNNYYYTDICDYWTKRVLEDILEATIAVYHYPKEKF